VTGGPPDEALKRALKFLGYCARSEAEVRAKLIQSGFSAKTVEPTLEKLRGLKLLDDEAFARNFTRGRIENRGYGPLRLERELRRKGVAQMLIRRTLDEAFGREEGKERARALLDKRFRGKDLSDQKTVRRAIAFLQRRGYRNSVIAEIVRQPIGED
jgi:regulatory protein